MLLCNTGMQGIENMQFSKGVIILRNGTFRSIISGTEQLFNISLHANFSCLGL